tara:strand:+ start:2430 stop:2951 length:522 start_codon:yes stop_codon:yes gene_type:complete
MSKIINALTKLSLDTEVYNSYEDKWEHKDQMDFPRKILIEAFLDKLYWLTKGKNSSTRPSGSEAYVTQQKARVKYAQETYRGDEISEIRLRGAIANCQAASDKHEVLSQMQTQLHTFYLETYGEDYLPYGSAKGSNVPVSAESDIPTDIQQQLEALGMAEPANEPTEQKKKKA